ncbi:hypothetical protein [Enterococcus sp. DIV0187]|uniref:hypothetical protein n=1 Tax=Enterococcus sp. DIV0187 TaxID=2774644 RepID=UPI003F2950B9
MLKDDEKEQIYQLMREISAERLSCLDQKEADLSENGEAALYTLEREKNTQQNYLFSKKQRFFPISWDSIY